MASWENMATFQPCNFRSTFAATDSWISEAFSRETQTFTKSLSTSHSLAPSINLIGPETTPTATVSNAGILPKHQRYTISSSSGKIRKRKTRIAKKSETTFIAADAANFRRMVQQVTGARFENSPAVLNPGLPLDQHQQRIVSCDVQSPLRFSPPAVVDGAAVAAFEFDCFSNFPTLESWKVALE